MATTFIYALAEPDTKAVRYVGKADNPKGRLLSHLRDRGHTRKARWLRSLSELPNLLVLEEVDIGSWQKAECKWIAFYRAQGANLTNHTDGGEGLTGIDVETRVRLSEASRIRMADSSIRSKIFTPERSARISAALSGKPKSAEHVAKLPQNRPGWHHTDEARAQISINAAGHRWTSKEIAALSLANQGNKYGMGNKSRTGQKQSITERQKKSKALRGRKKSLQTRERMRTAALARWAHEGRNAA